MLELVKYLNNYPWVTNLKTLARIMTFCFLHADFLRKPTLDMASLSGELHAWLHSDGSVFMALYG